VVATQQLFDFNVDTQPQPQIRSCTACKQLHPEHFFIKNTSTCKNCKSIRNKAYTDRLKQATPPWITKKMLEQIEQIKQVARELSSEFIQYEIDHIHSLNGINSCGLNVPWNLQIISSIENKQKKNKNGLLGGDYE
jgi:hypothetical protein